MSDTSSAPAGWYPTADGSQRWWDGSAWGPVATPTTTPVPPTPGSGKRVLIIVLASAAVFIALTVTGVVAIVNFVDNSQKVAAMCQRAADDPSLIDDLQALVQPLNDISFPAVPGNEPTAEKKLAIADQIPDLNSRLDQILTSSGSAYRDVWEPGTDIYIYLEEVAVTLQPDAPGSLSIDAGSTLESDLEAFSAELAELCAD